VTAVAGGGWIRLMETGCAPGRGIGATSGSGGDGRARRSSSLELRELYSGRLDMADK